MKSFNFLFIAFLLLSIPTLVGANQCEINFTEEGSFIKGKTYKTWALFDNVQPTDAYKKVYLYTVKDGWKITESDKELGVISASQDVSYGQGKTVPLNIVVEEAGSAGSKVSITYSTSGGVKSPTDAVKKHFCLTLNEVN